MMKWNYEKGSFRGRIILKGKNTLLNRLDFFRLIPGTGKRAVTPGTVQYVGVKRSERVEIDAVYYNRDSSTFTTVLDLDDIDLKVSEGGVTWINFSGVHDLEIIKKAGEKFGISSLTLEDIANTTQRTRVDLQDNYIFFVTKVVNPEGKGASSSLQQLSIIMGDGFLLTFFEERHEFLDPLVERIKNGMGMVRKLGSDYLMFAILNISLENYFFVIQSIAEMTEDIEIRVLENETDVSEHELYRLRRRLIFLIKPTLPLKEGIFRVMRSGHRLINFRTLEFYNELHDQASHLNETLESLKEIVVGLFDLYFSMISSRTNRIMKVLTVFASIFIPLTFLAGVYGMNFKYIPELGLTYGYFMFWGIVIVMIGIMVTIFRKMKVF